MKIGIIGAGNMGGTLGRLWAECGHEIMFGVRDPGSQELRAVLDVMVGRARVGSIADAAAFGNVVLLATPWSGAEEAVRAAGNLKDKVLIDCTNPIVNRKAVQVNGLSAAEQIARWANGAHVVKAFNTIGWNGVAQPIFDGQLASMFICGDEEGKSVAAQLAGELKFEVVDAGELSSAGMLEQLAALWLHLPFARGMGRDIAFALLRR